ncbi:hypothetical protein RRG08_011751 [Elysia crispata]|uniref:Uncharacterized protein n=1 Tax=Elysia crispata TaxID=231223 RepID=A0AAE0XEB4_9GAST|nr:hypothetical protein RRG08_011751 [Elysia crispata]
MAHGAWHMTKRLLPRLPKAKARTLRVFEVPRKRSVSHKFNNFPLVVVHVGSTRYKKRAVQQITARNVSSWLCHAVYGMRYSKSLCSIFFVKREVCRVSCATCRVPSMAVTCRLWNALL